MRLLLISMFIAAGLILGGVSSFANDTKTKTNTQDITLSGQINNIKGDSLIVKDNMGKTYIVIPADPAQLAYVKVGEIVNIKMKNGRAVAIHKTESMSKSEANVQDTLSGEITNIKGDSLWIKDSAGKTHTVIPAAPLQLEKVRVGENVTVLMRDGRAVAIYKAENTGRSESMEAGSQGTK